MAGKIFGAMVGLMVGLAAQSWWAAGLLCLAGLVAGHFYDDLHRAPDSEAPLPSPSVESALDPGPLPEPESRAELEAQARRHFADHLCALFAEVARADGEPVRDEVRVVREYFEDTLRYSAGELDQVRVALKEALARPRPLEEALGACREALPTPDRLMLLSALYELALADGDFRREEKDLIQRIAVGLGLSPADHQSVRAIHFPTGVADYARLGLEPAATDDDVKSAFRRLAASQHPDRVAHLGKGAVEVATRRFRELKEAYDAIRRQRGL